MYSWMFCIFFQRRQSLVRFASNIISYDDIELHDFHFKAEHQDMICLVGDAAMDYLDLLQTGAHIKAFDILSY